MKKIRFGKIFLFIVLLPLLVIAWLFLTLPKVKSLPELKNGDLVFQTINSTQTAAIIAASSSKYTHVGIVKIDDDGNPLVIEAIGPVREISLEDWIKQGLAGRIAIKRMEGLDDENAKKILEAAENYYGRPYDFFFYFDRESLYCSELVYYAFKDAISLELGTVESIKSLNLDNIFVKKLIEQRWHDYPLCKGEVSAFDKCYNTILEQELITPASIERDDRLITIYSNYAF